MCFSQNKEKIKGDRNVIQKTIDLDDLEITFSTQNYKNSYTINAHSNLHEVIKFEIIDSFLTIQTLARIRSKKEI